MCLTDEQSRAFLEALAPAHRLRLLSLVRACWTLALLSIIAAALPPSCLADTSHPSHRHVPPLLQLPCTPCML